MSDPGRACCQNSARPSMGIVTLRKIQSTEPQDIAIASDQGHDLKINLNRHGSGCVPATAQRHHAPPWLLDSLRATSPVAAETGAAARAANNCDVAGWKSASMRSAITLSAADRSSVTPQCRVDVWPPGFLDRSRLLKTYRLGGRVVLLETAASATNVEEPRVGRPRPQRNDSAERLMVYAEN
jgi:hypothetical protein